MRFLLAPLAALALTASSQPPAHDYMRISAVRIALDPDDPARVRVGRLRYLGGWVLRSADRRFGGLSAMIPRGDGFLAVGDAGGVFSLAPHGDRPPTGRVEGMLPAGPGNGQGKSDRDAESMTTDLATGQVWIGFEGHNAVWRYDAALSHAQAHANPPLMRGWPGNGGPEALVRLRDGRFLVFSEEQEGPDETREALLFASDPAIAGAQAQRFFYRPPTGYAVTDAAELPDGRLIVLHRRFTLMEGVSAVLSIVEVGDIAKGRTVTGHEVARLAAPLSVDNMEALAVTREGGATIMWIASDDNFSGLQRTLLLKFRLEKR